MTKLDQGEITILLEKIKTMLTDEQNKLFKLLSTEKFFFEGKQLLTQYANERLVLLDNFIGNVVYGYNEEKHYLWFRAGTSGLRFYLHGGVEDYTTKINKATD